MKTKRDSPGVFIPPPLFYVVTFVVANFIQQQAPFDDTVFRLQWIKIFGIVLLVIAQFFLVRSLRQFFQTKNTVVLIKPASTLQTSGIYSITRNPMYLGLVIAYLGLSCLIGNWWHLILLPVLFLVVQEYIIKSEEKYLVREFGSEYDEYRNKVRR